MSKKKDKKKYAICSCCGQGKHRTEMEAAILEMNKINNAFFKDHKGYFKLEAYDSFIDSSFDWACDKCLESKKAITANYKVHFNGGESNLAYFDTKLNCNTCQKKFIFAKEEKKYWYENLKFHIDSSPVNCADCRKEIRYLKNQNTVLSEILKKQESEISISEIENIMEIYSEWNKPEKVKYYKSLLNKLIKK